MPVAARITFLTQKGKLINKYCRDDRNLPGLLSLIPRRWKKQEQSVYQYYSFEMV